MLAPLPVGVSDVGMRHWLNQLRDAVNVSPQTVGSLSLGDQSATTVNAIIPNTAPTRTEGVYWVSVQSRVTQVAGTSSSLRITVSWIDAGSTVTALSAGVSGNVLTEADSFDRLIRADVGTAITVTVTRTSVGAPVMRYEADARIEAMPEALG